MFVPSKSITPFGLELDTFWLHSAAQTQFIAWLPRCRILTVFFFLWTFRTPREEAKEIEAKLIWDRLTDAKDSI